MKCKHLGICVMCLAIVLSRIHKIITEQLKWLDCSINAQLKN